MRARAAAFRHPVTGRWIYARVFREGGLHEPWQLLDRRGRTFLIARDRIKLVGDEIKGKLFEAHQEFKILAETRKLVADPVTRGILKRTFASGVDVEDWESKGRGIYSARSIPWILAMGGQNKRMGGHLERYLQWSALDADRFERVLDALEDKGKGGEPGKAYQVFVLVRLMSWARDEVGQHLAMDRRRVHEALRRADSFVLRHMGWSRMPGWLDEEFSPRGRKLLVNIPDSELPEAA